MAPNLRSPSRRRFLRGLGTLTCLGSFASMLDLMDLTRLAAAETATDYRALVCIFLYGGNDSFNCVVPADSAGYATYALARRELSVDRNSLLPLSDPTLNDPLGRRFGLHPALVDLHPLYETQRKLAILLNVGPLVVPLDKARALDGGPLPPGLLSHADQQLQTQTAGVFTSAEGYTGWQGRLADTVETTDGAHPLFASISVAGSNLLQTGHGSGPFVVDSGGGATVKFSKYVSATLETRLGNGVLGLLPSSPHVLAAAYADTKARALTGNSTLAQALAGTPIPAGFPDSALGRQLRTVAQIMAVAPRLGIRRQTFFCSSGGFDTHAGQNRYHPGLLQGLGQAMAAFHRHAVALNLADQVTTYTASEFGRTFAMNANRGTDHAWGGIQFVLGGAVRGGLYGAMPDQTLGGPDDMTQQGRFIPTLAVDQMASTLALWFGVPPDRLASVTPRIGLFGRPDLGFMTPS